jgi:hypothetical protein
MIRTDECAIHALSYHGLYGHRLNDFLELIAGLVGMQSRSQIGGVMPDMENGPPPLSPMAEHPGGNRSRGQVVSRAPLGVIEAWLNVDQYQRFHGFAERSR